MTILSVLAQGAHMAVLKCMATLPSLQRTIQYAKMYSVAWDCSDKTGRQVRVRLYAPSNEAFLLEKISEDFGVAAL